MHDVGLWPLFPPSYIAVEMIGMIRIDQEIQFLRRILKKHLQPILCVFVEIKNKKACLIFIDESAVMQKINGIAHKRCPPILKDSYVFIDFTCDEKQNYL